MPDETSIAKQLRTQMGEQSRMRAALQSLITKHASGDIVFAEHPERPGYATLDHPDLTPSPHGEPAGHYMIPRWTQGLAADERAFVVMGLVEAGLEVFCLGMTICVRPPAGLWSTEKLATAEADLARDRLRTDSENVGTRPRTTASQPA